MKDPKYSVTWDEYRKSICNGLSGLQQRGEYVDMTLAADGHRVKAHKMVLSLVSPYIRDMIDFADCPHPVIFLSKVSQQTLQSILEYAYTGEVVVSNTNIQEFLLACKELRIKGLEETTVESEKQQTLSATDIQDQVDDNADMGQDRDLTKSPTISLGNDDDSACGQDDESTSSPAIKDPVSKPTSTIAGHSTGLKFTVSNQGTAQIVLNRFMYNHRNTRKCGESLWRCLNYTRPATLKQRCPAYVVLRDNKVVQRTCAHNHGFHDRQILKRVRVQNLFTTMKEVQLSIVEKEAIKLKTISDAQSNSVIPTYDIEHITCI